MLPAVCTCEHLWCKCSCPWTRCLRHSAIIVQENSIPVPRHIIVNRDFSEQDVPGFEEDHDSVQLNGALSISDLCLFLSAMYGYGCCRKALCLPKASFPPCLSPLPPLPSLLPPALQSPFDWWFQGNLLHWNVLYYQQWLTLYDCMPRGAHFQAICGEASIWGGASSVWTNKIFPHLMWIRLTLYSSHCRAWHLLVFEHLKRKWPRVDRQHAFSKWTRVLI